MENIYSLQTNMQFFSKLPSDCPMRALFVHREDDNQRIREEAQSEHLRWSRAAELDTPVRTLIVINSFYPNTETVLDSYWQV